MTYDPRLSGTVLNIGSVSNEIPARTNSSGGALNRTDPIRLDASGNVQKVNVSIENEVLACLGCAKDSVANLASVGIVTAGRIEDVTVPGSLGDPLYISKTGGLTNIKPSEGSNGFVAGDFVVFVGIIVKNLNNPLLVDLMVNIKIVGQL